MDIRRVSLLEHLGDTESSQAEHYFLLKKDLTKISKTVLTVKQHSVRRAR